MSRLPWSAQRWPTLLILAVLAVTALVGSGISPAAAAPAAPAPAISVVSGNGQSAPLNGLFPQRLVAKVQAGNQPVSGARVTFTITSPAQTGEFDVPRSNPLLPVLSVTVPTGADGTATSPFLRAANASPVQSIVEARAPGVTGVARFTSTAFLTTTTAVSGGGQRAQTGATFAQPLVVRVTDTQGRPLSGYKVTFGVTSGAALYLGGIGDRVAVVVSGANGIATAPRLVAGPIPGPVVITAYAEGTPVTGWVDFAATVQGQPQAADIRATVSVPATVAAGSTFPVRVTVTNNGPSYAASGAAYLRGSGGVSAVDLGGGELVNFAGDNSPENYAVKWSAARLDAGQTVVLTVILRAAPSARGTYTYSTYASSVTPDPNGENNVGTATMTVTAG